MMRIQLEFVRCLINIYGYECGGMGTLGTLGILSNSLMT